MRNYKKKGNRGAGIKYSNENLDNAIDAVKSGQMNYGTAAATFGVPRSTIQLRVQGWKNRNPLGKNPAGKQKAIPDDIEANLAEHIRIMNRWGFGLTRKEMLDVVEQYVNLNRIKTPFKNGRPGEDWYLSFTKRHRLSLKRAELLEASRAKQHQDPFIIYDFFDKLEVLLTENDLMDKPSCIWNADETGFNHDPKGVRVIGEVAQRQSAGSGRDMTTVLACVSAEGSKMPPLILHKGKRLWENMLGGNAFPGTSYYVSENGWMTESVFFKWFEQIFLVHCTVRPAVLIYDGHLSHVSVPLIELAIAENVIILKLPPHTSALLQPLDVTVFKGVKSTWNLILAEWQRKNIGEKVTKSTFADLLGEVWLKIKDTTIINGFRKTGIYPCDRTAITETMFDKEKLLRYKKEKIIVVQDNNIEVDIVQDNIVNLDPGNNQGVHDNLNPNNDNHQPSTPSLEERPHMLDLEALGPGPSSATFEELLLRTVRTQKIGQQKQKRKRVDTAEIITKENYLEKVRKEKDIVAAKKNKKNITDMKKAEVPQRRNVKKKAVQKKESLELSSEPSESDEDVPYAESDDSPYVVERLEESDENDNAEMKQGRKESEENDFIVTWPRIKVGLYVVVKLSTKKRSKHYVALIETVLDEQEEIAVKFLKRKRLTYTFQFPPNEDVSTISLNEVRYILPKPIQDRRQNFSFDFNFSKVIHLE